MTRTKKLPETILARLWATVWRNARPSTHGRFHGDDITSAGSRLAVSPHTRVSQHPEGLTLLHVPSGEIFVCNRTAARIWQGATEGCSVDELSAEMSRRFRIEPEVAQKDTYSIVSQMELHGLIIRSGI